MNRHFKTQLRVIILTDKKLYRLDEKFKSSKQPILINDILSASITDEPLHQLVVLKVKNMDQDFVIYLESNNNKGLDRVPELLANIYRCRVQ